MIIVSKVNRLKQIVCIVTLALWATCTIHCELEMLTSVKASSCCNSGSESDQCICSGIASGGYIMQQDTSLIPPSPDALAVPGGYSRDEDALPQPMVKKLIFAPPELPKIWQFCLRTALAPRAPSFVS